MKRKYLAPSIDFHYITAKPEKQETNVLPSLPHWIKHRTSQTIILELRAAKQKQKNSWRI